MGSAFVITAAGVMVGDLRAVRFTVGFGLPGDNTVIVRDAASAMDAALEAEAGGPLALIFGPASLPAMAVIVHRLGHRFGAVAVWDPKLSAYVVAISHTPDYAVGQALALAAKESR
ncbi:MAG: CRISPR-associated protein Csx3 [Acidobacteriota bacterium]